jgi:hypothetical protein
LYSKSGGQGGKHNAVADSSSITALSNIGVQVFEHTHLRWFSHIPTKTAQLHTRQFALLPPKCFLLCLRSPAKVNETQVVEVSPDDFLEFESMTGGVERIKKALHKYDEE